MTVRDAFVVGYSPPAAGPYFNGLELLAEAGRGADGELARQIGEERERVVHKRDGSLARVDLAEAAQRRLGVAPVAGPEDAGAYADWAEAVFDRVASSLAGDSPEAVAHLLGYVLGEAMATLDAIAVLSRLRDLAPDHFWMRLQGDSLERERETAERRLGRLAAHPLLPEPAQTAAAMAAHLVAQAGLAGSHTGRASRADAAARGLADQAAAIDGSL